MIFLTGLAAVQILLLWLLWNDLEAKHKKIMATLNDLDEEISNDLELAAKQIEDALAAALTQIKVPPDVQPQIDHIKAIAVALRAAATSGAATVTVPEPPSLP